MAFWPKTSVFPISEILVVLEIRFAVVQFFRKLGVSCAAISLSLSCLQSHCIATRLKLAVNIQIEEIKRTTRALEGLGGRVRTAGSPLACSWNKPFPVPAMQWCQWIGCVYLPLYKYIQWTIFDVNPNLLVMAAF